MAFIKQEPDTLVKNFFKRVWKIPYDLSAIDEIMTEDFEINSAGKIIKGRENYKSWIKEFHRVLINAENEVLDIFYDENKTKVVARWICSGLNNGIFGLPADQKPLSFSGIAVWSIKEGRLSHCWVERSALEVYLTYLPNQSE